MKFAHWQILSLAAFAMVPLLAGTIKPNDYEASRRDNQTALKRRNNSAIGAILGEIRASMADMMFVKTEIYLHNGVAYMPHLDMEAMSERGEIVDDDHGDGDDGEEKPPTVIPAPETDFRGIIGELERRVKPWQDPDMPHIHTSGTELLPWYRVMTISDPTNVRAYQIGAWWLKGPKPQEALDFLREGMANNPQAFQLPYMAGQIALKLSDRSDSGDSGEHIADARRFFDEAADIVIRERPADYDRDHPENFPSWSEYKEEDARGAARFAVYLERDHGSIQDAIKKAERYSQVFGGDGVLDRLVERLGRSAN